MTAAVLTIAEVAHAVGLSTCRFRKVWAQYVRTRAFPAPFRQPPGAHYGWDAAEVAEWKARRARCGLVDGPAANDAHRHVHPLDRLTPANALPSANTNPALRAQRHALAAMMKRGA